MEKQSWIIIKLSVPKRYHGKETLPGPVVAPDKIMEFVAACDFIAQKKARSHMGGSKIFGCAGAFAKKLAREGGALSDTEARELYKTAAFHLVTWKDLDVGCFLITSPAADKFFENRGRTLHSGIVPISVFSRLFPTNDILEPGDTDDTCLLYYAGGICGGAGKYIKDELSAQP